jgi:hypothetical protein
VSSLPHLQALLPPSREPRQAAISQLHSGLVFGFWVSLRAICSDKSRLKYCRSYKIHRSKSDQLWGLAFFPRGPSWVADAGTGVASIYGPNGRQLRFRSMYLQLRVSPLGSDRFANRPRDESNVGIHHFKRWKGRVTLHR